MLNCFIDYIGLSYCSGVYEQPGSGLYLNSLPGISIESIDKIADSEQITYVLEGELFFKSEDTVYKLSKGDCILVPGNIDHEAWTEKSSARAIDAWSPVNQVYTANKKSLIK